MHDKMVTRSLNEYVTIAGLALLAPIVILVILAFSNQGYMKFPPESFSLKWFVRFFEDPRWQQALWSSVIIALTACVLATSIGLIAAYGFVRSTIRGKKLLLSFMLLPLIVPHVITAIAMYLLSGPFKLVGNVFWIGLCHATVVLPIVLLILLSTLQSVDINLERAALSLGASRLAVFWQIVIPLALPGIISAALFAFLASFDELVISLFLAGVKSETLPVRIWNSLHLQVEPIIAAVSAFLIGVTGTVLLLDALFRKLRLARKSTVG